MFVPINITDPGLHWALVVVDVEAKTLTYYDSALDKMDHAAPARRMGYLATVKRYDSKRPLKLSQLVTLPAAPPCLIALASMCCVWS